MDSASAGSVCPSSAITTGDVSPMPYSSDANVRRRPCGVSFGSGGSPSSSRSLARSTAFAITRLRTLDGFCCLPWPVPNTYAPGLRVDRLVGEQHVAQHRPDLHLAEPRVGR